MGYLGEVEAKTFLAKRGLPVNPTYQVDNLEVAREKGEELGYPVVLKVSSEKIVHKSDIGGVIPGISNSRELEEAFQSLEKNMRTIDSQASFSIQPHIFSSLELVLGLSTDPSFGQVIMFGLGGIWVEVLKDVSFRLVPIEERDAWQMIEEIKGKKLLEGTRGQPPVEKEALVQFLIDISDIAHRERVIEIDLNPVMFTGNRLVIADARMVLED